MKKLIYFFFLIIIFGGCKKDNGGKLAVLMTYKLADDSSGLQLKKDLIPSLAGNPEYYAQFGEYITSITPTVFLIKFGDMRLQKFEPEGQMWENNISLINGNLGPVDQARFADFTNNSTVELVPVIDGYDTRKTVLFNLLIFNYMFIYQEFALPIQYENITQLSNLQYEDAYLGLNLDNMMIGGERDGLIVKGSEKPFIKNKLFNNDMPHCYVFGSTDSTFIYNSLVPGQSINDPLGQGGTIVRSNRYTGYRINAIPENETFILHAFMFFDIQNLIQVYAGADNIPYTADDIFVYSPKYWERLEIGFFAID